MRKSQAGMHASTQRIKVTARLKASDVQHGKGQLQHNTCICCAKLHHQGLNEANMSCCGESPTVNSVQGLRRSYCLLGRTRCPQNTCRQQHSQKSCSCMPASYTKEKEKDEFSNMYAKDLTTHLLDASP
jgi:hypothetical protein